MRFVASVTLKWASGRVKTVKRVDVTSWGGTTLCNLCTYQDDLVPLYTLRSDGHLSKATIRVYLSVRPAAAGGDPLLPQIWDQRVIRFYGPRVP